MLAVTLFMGTLNAQDKLEIGEMIPMLAYTMKNVDGNDYYVRQEFQDNGLLIIFSCNTCPFVLRWEDRYNELFELCQANHIGMILVNSNEAKREGDDSYEKMVAKAKKEGYKMHYLVDTDHQLADAFGASTTPHVFLFDPSAKLAYRGLIDDNGEDKNAVEHAYLKDAIKNMLAGNEIDPATTKSIGCSIKRVSE